MSDRVSFAAADQCRAGIAYVLLAPRFTRIRYPRIQWRWPAHGGLKMPVQSAGGTLEPDQRLACGTGFQPVRPANCVGKRHMKLKPVRAQASKSLSKTVSELLFEAYLNSQGIPHQHEPSNPGTKKHPDYPLKWNGHELVCEVKELRARRPPPSGAANFDPYGGIRKEIHEVRRQFREYKETPCVLVLYNVDDWEFRDWPYVLFGTMLGDLGLRFPFDVEECVMVIGRERSAFLDGGKMIAPMTKNAQNTTISAIAVLSKITKPNPEFEREYERRLAKISQGRTAEPTIDQRLAIRMELYQVLPLTARQYPRVTVFENPLARMSLPREVFQGPYDARHKFNMRIGRIERVFAGRGLQELEKQSNNHGDILQQIEQFKQAIVEQFRPERIVLFGSHAHDCPEPDSDVDLLVVFQGKGNAANRSLEIRKRLNCDFALDLLTRSAAEIERRIRFHDPFICDIIENGMTLYESRHD